MNEALDFVMKPIVGRTIESVTNEAFRLDGSGPCVVIIKFTDGSYIHFDVEELNYSDGENGNIGIWYSQDRFKIVRQVLQDSSRL